MENTKPRTKLFRRDFTMVVIGQIISLFGNSILRYALPLYLLNQTHSSALFGTVSAIAFIPIIFFAPIGGIVADRINKRNIMVILDFSTAFIVLVFSLLLGTLSLVPLMLVVLMLLYGISGAYQPAVQASLPVLVDISNLNSANAVINMVSSLSSLIGPALGGIIYVSFGLMPILYIGAGCFVFSAIMEIFIHIPFKKFKRDKGFFQTAKKDISDSFHFIRREKREIGKIGLLLGAINCVFSALIIVGVPFIVTECLDFSKDFGNQLYGYSQAALAFGGLAGGLFAGIFGRKLKIQSSYIIIFLCTLTLVPMALAVAISGNPMLSYILIVISCVVMMFFSTIFSIQMMAYAQMITPENLIGKVIALITCLVLCANPLGQVIYGFLFEQLKGSMYFIFGGAFIICIVLSLISRKLIKNLHIETKEKPVEITQKAV